MKEFVKNLISGDEKRVSALIVALIFLLILCGYQIMHLKLDDITPNLLSGLKWISSCVAGGSVLPSLADKIRR